MPQLYIVCWRATVWLFREEYCATMIRGYVAVVSGDSSSADIFPDSVSCKKTAVTLATADENRFEFYIRIKGTGYSFKVIGNVRTVDKRNIASGRLRIGFIVPNLDIVVSGNPEELEAFVNTLVAVKDPRVLPPVCSDSTHEREFRCSYMQTQCKHNFFNWNDSKISVASRLEELCKFCCCHILQCYSRDDAHKILNTWTSCKNIIDFQSRANLHLRDERNEERLTQCLCYFESATVITDPVMQVNSMNVNSYPYLKKINASWCGLFEIPEALGSLPCLTTLDLSDNRLGQAKNWNWLTSPFLRENLNELYLARNQLQCIPETILSLRNLKILNLNYNHQTELPTALGSLKFLRELRIAGNKLLILPRWMYRKERFSMLSTIGSHFQRPTHPLKLVANPQLQRNEFQPVTVPSLFKTVATYIIANRLAFWEYNIPTTITEYLEAAYICRCDSVVFPDTTGPVIQCWIFADALAESADNLVLPIAIRCCSYDCYNLIEPFFLRT